MVPVVPHSVEGDGSASGGRHDSADDTLVVPAWVGSVSLDGVGGVEVVTRAWAEAAVEWDRLDEYVG